MENEESDVDESGNNAENAMLLLIKRIKCEHNYAYDPYSNIFITKDAYDAHFMLERKRIEHNYAIKPGKEIISKTENATQLIVERKRSESNDVDEPYNALGPKTEDFTWLLVKTMKNDVNNVDKFNTNIIPKTENATQHMVKMRSEGNGVDVICNEVIPKSEDTSQLMVKRVEGKDNNLDEYEVIPKIEEDTQISTKRKRSADNDVDEPCKIPKTEHATELINIPLDLSASCSKSTEEVSKNIVNNTNLVANHYNALKEKGLAERNRSRIVHMRNFNNRVKDILINEYVKKVRKERKRDRHRQNRRSSRSSLPEMKVLDMCCGKGGDLLKWKRAEITHLICADIAEISVDQCRNRYQNIGNKKQNKRRSRRKHKLFSAEFITFDCTKVCLQEKFKDPSLQLDLVSCQFALHYSFESLPQAECMLENASKCLRPGGFFIGTIPNANVLVARWQIAESNKIGNDVYSVEFHCDKSKPPLFGAKYNFYLEGVVNCPESLVYFPALRKLASRFGLEYIKFERFVEFYEKMNDDRETLLTTLSQSELEVIALYSVFAFQKEKLPETQKNS